jgi:hypothetical protein
LLLATKALSHEEEKEKGSKELIFLLDLLKLKTLAPSWLGG